MGRTYKQDVDRASIEQLAATLESKIGRADPDGTQGEDHAFVAPSATAAPSTTPLPSVLVAHADARVRGAVRLALERHFDVVETADGEDAWEMLGAHPDIRLLLTGTRLSRLDGIALIRRLRRPDGPPHLVGLPIMVYAEEEDSSTKQTALLAGANDYLTSGTDRGTLLARVQARNRLFERTRRAMNLTSTTENGRAGRTEPESPAPSEGVERNDSVMAASSERPIWVEARQRASAASGQPQSWMERLYRISSTTTITLTATVLVILAIALILLLNQTSAERPASMAMGRLDAAPTERAKLPKQTPGEPAQSKEAAVARIDNESAPSKTMEPPGGGTAEGARKDTLLPQSAQTPRDSGTGRGATSSSAPAAKESGTKVDEGRAGAAPRSSSAPSAPRDVAVTRRSAQNPAAAALAPRADETATPADATPPSSDDERAKAEQAKLEQARAEQAKAEQAKAEQAKAEQAKAEQAKAEQAKAEQAKLEQARAEQTKLEKQRIEQQRIEQERIALEKSEQAKAEERRGQSKREADEAKIASPSLPAQASSPNVVSGPDTTPPESKPEASAARSTPATPDQTAPVETTASDTAASPRPVPARLSRDELAALMQRFVSVYEAGDIEQFMALLADNVQTNDRVTRQAVRDDYARLFRTTDLREMRVEAMNWDVDGDRAHGWGEFEVRVRREGDAAVYHYQGSLTLQVRKSGGRPRIERLYHSERRASR